MTTAALVFLLAVIYYDSYLIKREDLQKFSSIFQISWPTAVCFIILASGYTIFAYQKEISLIFFYAIFVLPTYLLRRIRYKTLFRPKMAVTSAVNLLSDALEACLWWVFFIVSGSVVIESLCRYYFYDNILITELLLSALYSSIVGMVLIYKASQHFSPEGFCFNVALIKKDKPFLKIVIIPVVIGLFFACVSSYLIMHRPIQPSTPLSEILQDVNSPLAIAGFILLAVFVAPFIEEIIFRGYFYHVLYRVRGAFFAVFIVSLTFAGLHYPQYWGDWLAILAVTLLGFALTAARFMTGSTVASISMHYIYNMMMVIIPALYLVVTNPSYIEYQLHYDQYDSVSKERLLKQSIKENPKFSEAYNDLAWLYVSEEQNLQEALSLIDKALALDKNNKVFLDTKAEILEKLGDFKGALEIRRAILSRKLDPDYKKEQKKRVLELQKRMNSH